MAVMSTLANGEAGIEVVVTGATAGTDAASGVTATAAAMPPDSLSATSLRVRSVASSEGEISGTPGRRS